MPAIYPKKIKHKNEKLFPLVVLALYDFITFKGHEAPKLIINPDVKDFYKFTVDDFVLENYQFNKIDDKFEVAV